MTSTRKLATWKITVDNFGASRDVMVDAFGYNSSGIFVEFMDDHGVVLAVPESTVHMIQRIDAKTVEVPLANRAVNPSSSSFAESVGDVIKRHESPHSIRNTLPPHQTPYS